MEVDSPQTPVQVPPPTLLARQRELETAKTLYEMSLKASGEEAHTTQMLKRELEQLQSRVSEVAICKNHLEYNQNLLELRRKRQQCVDVHLKKLDFHEKRKLELKQQLEQEDEHIKNAKASHVSTLEGHDRVIQR
eukprot:4204491-Karenia_brevis.AAC.1